MFNKIKAFSFISLLTISTIVSAITVEDFDSSVLKLNGKSKDDVVSALGKPAGYKSGGDVEYFRYEGVSDKYTGKKSTASIVYFNKGKVDTKAFPTKHYFDKLPF